MSSVLPGPLLAPATVPMWTPTRTPLRRPVGASGCSPAAPPTGSWPSCYWPSVTTARRRSERRIKAAAFPAASRCAYSGLMPFLRFFGQVGTLRMRPRRRASVAGYLCGSVADQCRRGWMPRCPMVWRCVNPGAGGSSGSSGGRALMTWGRCSGRVPRSASHRRRQLRASRATGAIARASRGAVASAASAASARLKGLLGMPSMGAPRTT
jgi:hypothetical protein